MLKSKKIFTKHDSSWKILDRIGIILGIAGFIITVFQIWPDLKHTKSDVQMIQDKLNSNEVQDVLYSYFYNIEQGNFKKAFDLFTEQKKSGDRLENFSNWLKNFVAFEGLVITELKEKNSASKKVFLAEFGFKNRGAISVKTKWGFYLIYNGEEWKIDYSNVLYENGYRPGACDFYKFEDHCK